MAGLSRCTSLLRLDAATVMGRPILRVSVRLPRLAAYKVAFIAGESRLATRNLKDLLGMKATPEGASQLRKENQILDTPSWTPSVASRIETASIAVV